MYRQVRLAGACLEAAAVGDEGPLTVHEFVQSPRSLHQVRPRVQEQMVRIAEHELLPLCSRYQEGEQATAE